MSNPIIINNTNIIILTIIIIDINTFISINVNLILILKPIIKLKILYNIFISNIRIVYYI